MLLRQFLHLREGRQLLAAADDDRRGLLPEQLLQRFVALFCRQTGQKVHLCQTHDLQAELIEVIIVASQKQTRAVDLSDLHTDLIQLPGVYTTSMLTRSVSVLSETLNVPILVPPVSYCRAVLRALLFLL